MTDRWRAPAPGGAPGPRVGPVVIELGVLRHDDPADDDPTTTSPRPSPWLVILLVAVCCVAGLAAAQPPPGRPRLVATVDLVSEAPRLVGDGLITQSDGPDGPTVAMRALADGALRWQHRPTGRVVAFPAGPVVLLAPVSCRSWNTFATEAVDTATGTPRWRRPGMPVWLVVDAPMAVFKQPVRGCAEATVGFDPLPSTAFVWSGVDLESGAVRWSVPVPASATLTAGVDATGRASWLAVGAAGAVTVHDLRTGAVAGSLAATSGPVSPVLTRILGAGERLLSVERNRGTFTLSGFDAPGLTARWRSTVRTPATGARLELDGFTARRCGPVVCLGPPSETIGIDPDTGAETWRVPGRPVRVGPRFGLFVRSPAGADAPLFVVHDLLTGQVRAELANAALVGRPDNAALLTTPAAEGGRLWRLELTGGELRPLTTLPTGYAECDTDGRYLACRRSDRVLHLWRLPTRCPPSCGPVQVAVGPEAGVGPGAGGRAWPTS